LWANLHIQFVNGLFLLGLACAAPLLDRLLGWEGGGGRRPAPSVEGEDAARFGTSGGWQLVALTGACLPATLLNPSPASLYQAVIELPTQSGAYNLIDELKPLAFRSLWHWAVLGLAGLAAFSLGRRAKLSSFEILLLATSAFFSFRASRDSWL